MDCGSLCLSIPAVGQIQSNHKFSRFPDPDCHAGFVSEAVWKIL